MKKYFTLIFLALFFMSVYAQSNHSDKEKFYNEVLGTFEVQISGRQNFAFNYQLAEEVEKRRKDSQDVIWQFSHDVSIVIYSRQKVNSPGFKNSNNLIIKHN
jgi:hypothetical protein